MLQRTSTVCLILLLIAAGRAAWLAFTGYAVSVPSPGVRDDAAAKLEASSARYVDLPAALDGRPVVAWIGKGDAEASLSFHLARLHSPPTLVVPLDGAPDATWVLVDGNTSSDLGAASANVHGRVVDRLHDDLLLVERHRP